MEANTLPKQSETDAGLEGMICHSCNVATFEDHQEFFEWLKCCFCGFCKKKTKLSKEQILGSK